jgi:LuxR family maltose regulon positive regulatory protein
MMELVGNDTATSLVVQENQIDRRPTPDMLDELLSARELEILGLIAAGHSNQAIADTLIVAVGTVKKHVNNIFGKLEVQSRTQAVMRARALNLL